MVVLVSKSHAVTIEDLTSKDWILKSINGVGIHLTSYTGKKPRLKFFDDLRFAAWAGCNDISGSYHFKETDSLNFDQNMITTQMACNTPQNIEREVLTALQAVRKVDISNNFLQLMDDQNKLLLEYILL